MKLRIALFGWTKYPDWSPVVGTEINEEVSNYVRVSEYVEVEFPEIPQQELTEKRTSVLRKHREDLIESRSKKTAEIDESIAAVDAQLAAISSNGATAESATS